MANIRCRVGAWPQPDEWDVPAAPGTFLFDLRRATEHYRGVVTTRLPFVHMHSRRGADYRRYLDAVETLAWLERRWLGCYERQPEEAFDWPEHFATLDLAPLIEARDFVSVSCPVCEASYEPDAIHVRTFGWIEGLVGGGGWGAVCPRTHGLFVVVTVTA